MEAFLSSFALVLLLWDVFLPFLLIPPAIEFLLSFAKENLEPVISASKYISFVISLIFGCGFVFSMPLLLSQKSGYLKRR